MGEVSKIQWTEATWNPWHGCKKVSEGCKFCYMYRDKERYGQNPMSVLRSKTNFKLPLKIKEPTLIFTCSWSDWFIEEADEWRAEAWEIIKATPQHTYQILTKRPERILQCLPSDWGEGYANVWLGVSVESNKVRHRIEEIARIPAAVLFISFEPLLEEIDLNFDLSTQMRIDWAIFGGESGNDTGKYQYRPCKLYWIENMIKEIHTLTPVFVKQLGTYLSKELLLKDRHGGDINEFPDYLQIREFPYIYERAASVE